MNHSLLKTTLRKHEGYRNKVYQCSAGKLTIGIGHNLDDLGLDDNVIELQFQNDVEKCVADCGYLFDSFESIPDNKQSVLANMMFNMGLPVLSKFKKMIKAVDNQQWDEAANQMLDSRWAGQVGNRAVELSNIMRG